MPSACGGVDVGVLFEQAPNGCAIGFLDRVGERIRRLGPAHQRSSSKTESTGPNAD